VAILLLAAAAAAPAAAAPAAAAPAAAVFLSTTCPYPLLLSNHSVLIRPIETPTTANIPFPLFAPHQPSPVQHDPVDKLHSEASSP